MKLTMEFEREEDGRWIARIPELDCMAYGSTVEEVMVYVQEVARHVVAEAVKQAAFEAHRAALRREEEE